MAAAGADPFEAFEQEAEKAIGEAASLADLQAARAHFLGRKGALRAQLGRIGSADPDERPALGRRLNEAKARIEERVRARRAELESDARERALREHRLDVTLPGVRPPRGRIHPVARLEREMVDFFAGLGFSVAEGPEVELEELNFGALNFPDDHPARDMQDTIYVEGGHVLRTHTSPVQVRAMRELEPPLRLIAPGRVFRHDLSPRHSPMFHQIEGLMVDERTHFGDLKGILYAFARRLFGPQVELRFRASFFPFTEPSAELDFSCTLCGGAGCATCSQSGWMEWGGCGMVHPHVLAGCDIDPGRYQGFAFGMGIDRSAMIRHGIPVIHLLFEADVRVLEQV